MSLKKAHLKPGKTAVLFLRALFLQQQAGRRNGARALELVNCPVSKNRFPGGAPAPEDIQKTVERAMRLGAVTGGINSCLTRSVVSCRLMRESGTDARVIVGLKKDGGSLDGHAWTAWPGGEGGRPAEPGEFADFEIYPDPARYPGWIPDTDDIK